MMALRRRALWGWGKVAAPRRPGKADGYACCSCGTPAQGVCGRRVGGARELPPQRDIVLAGSSCVVVVAAAGLAAVVWWGLPRLYGGAHTKTTQMDRHGQGAESGEWMRSRAFRPLHYVLSCRAFRQLRRRRWRRGGARACVPAAGGRRGGVGQTDGSIRDVADDVRHDPWRLGRCLGRLPSRSSSSPSSSSSLRQIWASVLRPVCVLLLVITRRLDRGCRPHGRRV